MNINLFFCSLEIFYVITPKDLDKGPRRVKRFGSSFPVKNVHLNQLLLQCSSLLRKYMYM